MKHSESPPRGGRGKVKFAAAVGGALAGAVGGFFGAGGGAVLVPVFTRWAKIEDRRAYASTVAVILPLCAVSAAVYFRSAPPDIMTAAPYLAGGLIGGFIGGRIFKNIPVNVLRKAFGLMLVYCGIRCFL